MTLLFTPPSASHPFSLLDQFVEEVSRRPLYYYYTIVKYNGSNFLIIRYFVQNLYHYIRVICTYVCYSLDFNLISAIGFI